MAIFVGNFWVDDNELITIPDTSDPTQTYFAQAVAGSWTASGRASAIWRIWIVDSNGRKLYAEGNAKNVHVYNDRAGYTYK